MLARELRNLLLFSKIIVADGTKIRFLTRSIVKFLEVRKSLLGSRRSSVMFGHSSEDFLKKLVEAHKAIREKIDGVKKNSDSGSGEVLESFRFLWLRMSLMES